MSVLSKNWVLRVLIVIVLIGSYFFYREISYSGKVTGDRYRQKYTVMDIGDGWSRLENETYHYQIDFPTTSEISVESSGARMIYRDISAGRYFGSIDVRIIGLLDEPLETTALRIAPAEFHEFTSLNGYDAVLIDAEEMSSDVSENASLLVRNSDNLNILVRINARIDEDYEALLMEAMNSFRFVGAMEKSRTLRLSGKLSVSKGDCMPGASDPCYLEPVKGDISIYSLITCNGGYLEENEPVLVKQVRTNKLGYYSVRLKPGSYTVFVEGAGEGPCDYYADNITMYESDEEYSYSIDQAPY